MIPIIHTYKEINVGKYKSVKHYELIDCTGSTVLTNIINISLDRQFAKRSNPKYWLKTHNGKKWSLNITGLFETSVKNVLLGDLNKKQHLLIIQETENGLTVYVYVNYYPYNIHQHPKQIAKGITQFNP